MKVINTSEKLSSISLISYSSHTGEGEEICCHLKSEASMINTTESTAINTMAKRTTMDKGYKNPNFLTAFHHRAFLDSLHVGHGKLKVNRRNCSNPMLPKIPYLAKKSHSLPSPRLKSNHRRHEEYQTIRVSRSTSPIKFSSVVDDIKSKVKIEDFPNEIPLDIDEQLRCLDEIEKQFKPTHGEESIENCEKRKEKAQDIPKDIPLELLNKNQRMKKGHVQFANKSTDCCNNMKIKENSKVEAIKALFCNNNNIEPDQCKKLNRSIEGEMESPKRNVLQQILFFDKKSKSNNEDKRQYPKSFLSQSHNVHHQRKSNENLCIKNCDETKNNLKLRTRDSLSLERDNNNFNKAKIVNRLFEVYSSGTVSTTSSEKVADNARFGNERNEYREYQRSEFLHSRFNQAQTSSNIVGGSNSIVETIKAKFFQRAKYQKIENNREKSSSSCVGLENKDFNLKFPKETRNAVTLLINNTNKIVKPVLLKESPKQQQEEDQRQKIVKFRSNYCRHHYRHNQGCELQFKRQSEIQTLTKATYAKANVNDLNNPVYLPCPKNLLCEKGVHRGKCGRLCENYDVKNMLKCSSNCECNRKMSFWSSECQNVWPGSARRYERNDNNDGDDADVNNEIENQRIPHHHEMMGPEVSSNQDALPSEEVCYRCRRNH